MRTKISFASGLFEILSLSQRNAYHLPKDKPDLIQSLFLAEF
jgi:hypothetical protein